MWQPLAPPERRPAIASVVREIADALDGAPPRALGERVDRALLRAYLAEADVVPDPDDVAGAELSQAVAALAQGAGAAGLHGGMAGVGWAVAHVADEETAALVCGSIDAALARALEAWEGDHDLISGLVGIGVYALERGAAGRALAGRVLEHLARRARPRAGGLAWHTAPGLLVPWQAALAPEGYWNLGLAHGAPGVIALLARLVAAGVERARARELLDGAVAALLAAEPPRAGGRYGGWQAGPAGEQAAAARDPAEPRGRLAWCYGDLGVSVALLSAAHATGDARWRAEALALARSCAGRSIEDARVFDAAICHGAIGAAHLFNRLGQASGEDELSRAAERWLDRALAMRGDRPFAGFPRHTLEEGGARWSPDASLVTGAAGVALVLHAMITDVEPAWDRLLLADLEPAQEQLAPR